MKTKIDPYEGAMILWSMPGLGHLTMRRKQLQAFLEATGGDILARGRRYDVTTKHLGAGVYRVSTKLATS